jgi:hypothetical protein
MVAKVRERLAVNKQTVHVFRMEKFKFKKLKKKLEDRKISICFRLFARMHGKILI